MKRWLLLVLACLTCCSSSNEQSSLLYVIQADHGKIEKVNGEYYFVMSNLAPHMIAFTDRPERKASFMKVGAFIDHWGKGKDSFEKDPPNASLSGVFLDDENGKQVMHILEIFQPKYDSNGKQLRFKVKSIEKTLPLEELEVKNVTLFIDVGYGGISHNIL